MQDSVGRTTLAPASVSRAEATGTSAVAEGLRQAADPAHAEEVRQRLVADAASGVPGAAEMLNGAAFSAALALVHEHRQRNVVMVPAQRPAAATPRRVQFVGDKEPVTEYRASPGVVEGTRSNPQSRDLDVTPEVPVPRRGAHRSVVHPWEPARAQVLGLERATREMAEARDRSEQTFAYAMLMFKGMPGSEAVRIEAAKRQHDGHLQETWRRICAEHQVTGAPMPTPVPRTPSRPAAQDLRGVPQPHQSPARIPMERSL